MRFGTDVDADGVLLHGPSLHALQMNAAKRDKVKAFAFNIDATDEVGNKMETAVLKAEIKITEFIMKLCTSDGNKRSWGNGWWGQSSPTNAASAANHESAHKDIKTASGRAAT